MTPRLLTEVPEKMKVVCIDNGWRKMSFGGLMSICGVGESGSRIPFGHIMLEMSINHQNGGVK